MIDEYEDRLAAAEIDFHIEPVTLADGIGSVTARWKFEYMRRMAERFSEYERIVFTDAWDVLFFGSKADLLPQIPANFLVSAERNCWPEGDLAAQIESDSAWKFCNAGMSCGSPERILEWIQGAMKCADLDLMEQVWFNRRLVDGAWPVWLDWGTSIFYTVSYDREAGELGIVDGKLVNTRYDSRPQFFHFAGPCSSVSFRAMLRTGKPLCASA